MGNIKNFTDLEAWQVSHNLVIDVYKVTSSFPKSEVYGLTSQLRRSAVSVTSNIAEGFGRVYFKEKIKFYNISSGSLFELKDQLIISRDVGYLSTEEFKELLEKADSSHRLINGLIKSSKKNL